VRDWYVESFKELRAFPSIKDSPDEGKFTELLRHIYRRHANVVPVMAKGVAELKRDLVKQQSSLVEMPEIHQFLDGFYLSRIGIRILIGGLTCLCCCSHPCKLDETRFSQLPVCFALNTCSQADGHSTLATSYVLCCIAAFFQVST
jgi:hypothetical protein